MEGGKRKGGREEWGGGWIGGQKENDAGKGRLHEFYFSSSLFFFKYMKIVAQQQNRFLTFRLSPLFFPQIYELRVMETKPDKAVSIIECDMNVSHLIAYSAINQLLLVSNLSRLPIL